MQNSHTACPLDCFDACSIIVEDGKLKGERGGHTQGFLCPHLNHYESYKRIESPRYRGEEISMQVALEKLKEILTSTLKSEILHYRGSGNFALMQEVTDHFFASYGAVLTDGSLCDGAGEAGIIEGRGSNKNMPFTEIAKSDVVIFWGRNPHVTSSHILPMLKGKKIIVIDPVKTKIAEIADLHIQIKPHSDIYLAMLLVRFIYIHDMCDEAFLEEFGSEFEDFYELTQTIRIKARLEDMGVTLGDIGSVLSMMQDSRVAIVCGIGVQKYRDGADIMRAIDSVAVALGMFGKEGCGVSYLGNSKEGVESPFHTKAKRVSKIDTEFDAFKSVFIQGANPLAQMPDSERVALAMSRVENIIYFGLYENESSAVADLVIPAKSFLEKEDVRLSYGHNGMLFMPKIQESEIGISEYDLSAYLCDAFDIELASQEHYLEHFRSFAQEQSDGSLCVKGRESIPYSEGFDTDDGEFVYLDELEITHDEDDALFLITPKSPTSLNSQFKRSEFVYLNSSLGIDAGRVVRISSESGSVELEVRHDERLREDCVLIYSGTKGVNKLTSSKHSYEGKNAVFQENKVEISKI